MSIENKGFKFTGKISKMGNRMRVISIPKVLHAFLEEFEGKKLRITVEEV